MIDPRYIALLQAEQQRQMQRQQQRQSGSPMLGGLLGLGAAGYGASQIPFSSLASSIPSEGFSSLGEMLGNGLMTEAPGSMQMSSLPATDITNFAGEATPYLGAAGAAMGAYNAFKGIKEKNPLRAGLGGTGVGLGINAMGWGLGPAGWAATVAAPVVLSLANKYLDKKSTKEIQADRWNKVNKPELAQSMAGRDYFAGTGGEKSRDEKFLTADAIRMNPDNYNNISDWDSWTRQNQDNFLNTMLKEGRVQERKGGIYYDDKRAQELAKQIISGQFNSKAPLNLPADIKPIAKLPADPSKIPDSAKPQEKKPELRFGSLGGTPVAKKPVYDPYNVGSALGSIRR